MFWDMASWHMAYNASVAAREDKNQPREALRIKAEREYWKVGEDFLLRGIQNNPDHALLYDRLGMVYRDKFKDHQKAFEAYEQGWQIRTRCLMSDASPRMNSRIPGRERSVRAAQGTLRRGRGRTAANPSQKAAKS
jgi:hypothetical protein